MSVKSIVKDDVRQRNWQYKESGLAGRPCQTTSFPFGYTMIK